MITTNETFLTMTKKTKPARSELQIGKQIEFHRKRRDLSRPQLAKKIGKSYQQIQNYEEGKNRVAASVLEKIAKALKYPIENFFEKSED